MKTIPYIEYTQLSSEASSGEWYYMSHLDNACASLEAHRTSAYAICLLSKGEIQVETNLFIHQAIAPALFLIPPAVITKFTETGSAYDAKIFFFRKKLFLEGQADISYLDRYEFFRKGNRPLLPLDPGKFQLFKSYFDLLETKSADTSSHAPDIVRSLIYIILNEVDTIYQPLHEPEESTAENDLQLLAKFKELLTRHFIKERKVAFYAEKLHLSPKYFSTIIRDLSGKTAGAWINEMLLLEMKVRLQNKDQSITQIADDLNFSDPSHFGKFFKKHIGISPLEYRKG